MASKLNDIGMAFLTVCRDMGMELEPGLKALKDNMKFARQEGYAALEVAAFPASMPGETTKRDFFGETINVDWVLTNQQEAVDGVTRLRDETGVELEALCYCGNTLGNTADEEHVKKLIGVASVIGIPNVVTFIGNLYEEIEAKENDMGRSMSGPEREDYFRTELKKRIKPLVEKAQNLGIGYTVENCPMRGAMGYSGQSLTSNWFSCPAEWDIVLETVPGIKMWFDPSHLRNYRPQNESEASASEFISKAIERYGKHFAGVHLKDGEDDVKGMEQHYAQGDIFGENTHTGELWIARAPGKGKIDWRQFEEQVVRYAEQALVRSVEMEDLDVAGRAANEQALREVKTFYQPIINAVRQGRG